MARSGPASFHAQPLVLGAMVALLIAVSVAVVGERHAVGILERARAAPGIPGVTVGDDEAMAAMPVVTSLRSNCEAARRGLRVGDHIDAVDGQRVRSAAQLQRAVDASDTAAPVALHIRRGDTLWTVAIDRIEPAGQGRHDAQDTSG